MGELSYKKIHRCNKDIKGFYESVITTQWCNPTLPTFYNVHYRMRQINKNEIYNMLAETGGNVTVADRNCIKNYIKHQLGIPLINGGIRAIYIKLFLEGRINEEEFRELVLSRDIEIDLYELLPPNYRDPYSDYVFINKLG